MAKADVRDAVVRVLAALREAGRAEDTVRRQQVVLDRFVAFLAGRGLDTVSDQVCVDFIANQTGIRLARWPCRPPVVEGLQRESSVFLFEPVKSHRVHAEF